MNKYIDKKHINSVSIIVASYILFYFILNPYSLQYYFHNCLGKSLLLLYMIHLTIVSPLFAIVFTIVIIGLYNFMIFTVEGMSNMGRTEKKALLAGKEGYNNIDVSLRPSYYGTEMNKIITVEKYMRPKSSNALMILDNPSKNEPAAYFSGKKYI